MSVDWDAEVLGPVMGLFGENNPANPADQSAWPLYTPTGQQAPPPFRLADAIFDREYLLVTTNDDGSDNTTRRPVLGVRLSLFERPPQQGDRVMIPSAAATYIVREVQPDSHGEAKLMLMKTAS